MSLKGIVRDGIGGISRRGFSDTRRKERERGRSVAASSSSLPDVGPGVEGGQGSWAGLPPELLREVIGRVEQSEAAWPGRRHLVACASVCRSWRRVCKDIVGAPEVSGKLTFPVSLKQPGSHNGPIQCYIKRNKATSSYQLFLGLNPANFTSIQNGKFLLAARKIRRPAHAEYIISMASEDISRNSVSYMGKLRSNFLGTKFAIYDSQPPYSGALTSSGRSSRRFYSRKVSPKVPSGSYGIAHIAYELNMLGTRGPRRMRCTMHSIPASALEPSGFVPTHNDTANSLEDSFSSMSLSRPLDRLISEAKSMDSTRFTGSTSFADSSRFTDSMRFAEVSIGVLGKGAPLVLKNKAPRWHEQLQCWCLNFRGRVTVASVKNFQLIAASEEPANANNTAAATSQPASSEHDKIILQFGKIGRDLFTMDYRYPLSAFQAFGICLSSFDTKLACE